MSRDYFEKRLKPLLQCFLDGYANNDVRALKFVIGKQTPLPDERRQVQTFVSRILKISASDVQINAEHYQDETSYTIDKSKIFMCVQQKEKIHERDLLVFVLLHELTHVGSLDQNHDGLFWQQFHFLCDVACNYDCGCNHKAGFDYCTVDFSKNVTDYCGKQITYHPLFDPGFAPFTNWSV